MKGRIFLFLIALFLLCATSAQAASTQATFTSCTNPQGTTVASYADGVHGIAGDSATHTGSDAVFQISSTQYTQCFCDGENGTQTNWLNVKDMSFDVINQWEKQGWIYIPDGSLWGLDADPYLAFNMPFACPTGKGGGSGSGTSGGSSGGSSSVSGVSTSSVQGVLGAWAGTGLFTEHLFNTLGVVGLLLLIPAFVVSKRSKTL